MIDITIAINRLQDEVNWRLKDIPRLKQWIAKGELQKFELDNCISEIAKFRHAIHILNTYPIKLTN